MSRFLAANGLNVENDLSSGPTFIKQMRNGSTRTSYIDLVITNDRCSNSVTGWTMYKDKIHTEHNLIQIQLNVISRDQFYTVQNRRFNFKKVNFTTLYNTFDLIKTDLDANTVLVDFGSKLLNAIIIACEASAPKVIQKKKESPPWYNQACRKISEQIDQTLLRKS